MASANTHYLISDEELLLIFNTTRSGDFYISDSTNLGKTYTLEMLLDEPGDHCPRILVLNTRTLKSSDVTEMFATEWLKRADKDDELEVDADFTVDDLEAGFPTYVRESRAWKVWRDDLEAERPIESVDTYNALRRDRLSSPSLDFRGEVPALASAVGRKMEEA